MKTALRIALAITSLIFSVTLACSAETTRCTTNSYGNEVCTSGSKVVMRCTTNVYGTKICNIN